MNRVGRVHVPRLVGLASGRVYEVGGPDVLQYWTMLRRVAAIEHRPLLLLPVPLLTPRLSSLWPSLVTDIDTGTGRALIDSMTNEVIVRRPVDQGPDPAAPCGPDRGRPIAGCQCHQQQQG